MDLNADYTHDPPSVIFTFDRDGRHCTGAVSLHALAVLHGQAISTAEEAISVYRHFWRRIHTAALGLHACGHALPFVRADDVA